MSEVLRCLESTAQHTTLEGREIERMYKGDLDAVIIRAVFPDHALDRVAAFFKNGNATANWNRPNKPIPGIDLRLLGVGAAPSATNPAGPDPKAYLEAAADTPDAIRAVFGETLDPFEAVEDCLRQVSTKPVAVPTTADMRRFSACTLRAIPSGAGLMVHHDNHYQLPVYDAVRAQLDTSALLSFFVLLQPPEAGGRLCIYSRGPEDDRELPLQDNGMPDPAGFDRLVPHQFFELARGDMIVFASSRLYHTVERVEGSLARVTLGGFTGLDATHQRCFYWS